MMEELDPERLRRLSDAAARLPRSIDPSRDAWPAIRDRIEAGRVRAIAPESATPTVARPRRLLWLAAAAVLLIALSSGVTTLVMLDRAKAAATTARGEGPTPAPETPELPLAAPPPSFRVLPAGGASVDVVFARYDAAADELAAELQLRRAWLAPATLAVLDSCLRKIDAAILEARSALRAEPRDAVLTGLLTVSYRQKLDLLKRATELPTGMSGMSGMSGSFQD